MLTPLYHPSIFLSHSAGYNTPHSGIASGVMTPADLDLPLVDFEGFDDFPAGSGFQDLPVATSQPPAVPPTITTSQQQQQQQATHQYPPQPQAMVNLQHGNGSLPVQCSLHAKQGHLSEQGTFCLCTYPQN